MNLRSAAGRLVWCGLFCLLIGPMVGCAGPRLGSRIFPQLASSEEPAPQYVSGQLPLPSEQAVRPASLGMPSGGQYDAQTVSDMRSRRSGGFLNSSRGSNCFS